MWDVIVAGLGAMGSATTYQLSKRGQRVLGLDAFHPPHTRGSSHGHSRLTRQAIGEGMGYTPLALRSHAIWRELEAQTGQSLLTVTGGLVISSPAPADNHHAEDFFGNTVRAARDHGIDYRILDRADMRRRYPQFDLAADEYAYFEPGAGYVRPERCIATQLQLAEQQGATLQMGDPLLDFESSPDGVVVHADSGRYTAKQLVLCLGARLPDRLGPWARPFLRVTRQVLYWFEPARGAPSFAPERFPVFIWESQRAEHSLYGFPALDGPGSGVKIASGNYLETTTADSINREVSEAEIQHMYTQNIAPCFPTLSRRCVQTATCMYTVTPDTRFIIDAHPDDTRILLVSPCSGHGFKHSAALGEAVAEQLIDGDSRISLASFSLAGRFGTTAGQ